MLLKTCAEGVTPILAEEFRGLADFLKACFRPGLVGAANLARISCVGAVATANDFGAGDMLYTGGALVNAFDTTSIDFATAGAAGGPLAAGTYKIYVRLEQGGTTADRYYVASLCATDESNIYDVDDNEHEDARYTGTIDETVYLVLRTGVMWDGTNITDDGDDDRTNRWGTFNEAMLRGTFAEAVIDDRDIQVTNLDAGTIDATTIETAFFNLAENGIAEFMENHQLWLGENGRMIFQGSYEIDGTAGDVRIDLGADSNILLRDSATLELANGAKITGDSISGLDMDGFVSLGATGWVSTPKAQVYGTAPAGTPEKDTLYAGLLVRALAKVTVGAGPGFDITVGGAVNIASVSRGGVGTYQVHFTRSQDDVHYFALAYALGDNVQAEITNQAAGALLVHTRHDDTADHTAVDSSFAILVVGGVQAN